MKRRRLLKPYDGTDVVLLIIAAVCVLEAIARVVFIGDVLAPMAFAFCCGLLVRLRAAERELARHRAGDRP